MKLKYSILLVNIVFFVLNSNCFNTNTNIKKESVKEYVRIDTLKHYEKDNFYLNEILNTDSFSFIWKQISHKDYLSFESTVSYLNKKFKTKQFDSIIGLAYTGFLASYNSESYVYILEMHIKNKTLLKSILNNMAISKKHFQNLYEGPYDWDFLYNESSGCIIFYETGYENPQNEVRILLDGEIKRVLNANKK